MSAGYTLGLNQYTHSASAVLLDADGCVVFALSKERVTRKKHDGGDTAELVRHVLEQADIKSSDLSLVVANNHLFRISPFEETLPWAAALDQYRPGYLSDDNLLPGVRKVELTHHLAHAWSVLQDAPFDDGLIVVMDGIGSTWHDLHAGDAAPETFTDLDLPKAEGFEQVPHDPDLSTGWREGESAFLFRDGALARTFKRWIAEKTPNFLYNYGFENMESLGAVYSRISSHIFGDWNACGKIMGLAPCAGEWAAETPRRKVMSGPLESLKINWARLHAEPAPNQWANSDNHPKYARLADDVQKDLEDIALDFLKRLREKTGATHLCLVGGVALNSTLNGRIHRESGFEQVYIPPAPGDDGVALGCARFGHALLQKENYARAQTASDARALADGDTILNSATKPEPFHPYQGTEFEITDIQAALQDKAAWLEWVEVDDAAESAAHWLAESEVIGWFQGRSEFGPRALGNRSILATPADGKMIKRINSAIKKRESYRPFAPTVLADHADDWFQNVTPSPYMSLTVNARTDKAGQIPAVIHFDGTARIQTLRRRENPLYHRLIEGFHKRTGIPMVLNTSFNIKGEPLVDSPSDAIRAFLDSDLDAVFLGPFRAWKRPWPADADELGDSALGSLTPQADSTFTAEVTSSADGDVLSVRLMAGGNTHDADAMELGLLEHSDGTATVAELEAFFVEEFDAEVSEIHSRLERLWKLQLLHFIEHAATDPEEVIPDWSTPAS
ncbi:MAG: hypothetical protein HN844_06145 [Planctomycetes bacterium]|jgi:carbamoyltransferase|nr:hypothetical protein [Planctomycetota bacterium]MBT7318783.1 hypothetical protein [Planctomycetota bacterium]